MGGNCSGDTLTQTRPHLLIVTLPVNLGGSFPFKAPQGPSPAIASALILDFPALRIIRTEFMLSVGYMVQATLIEHF